MGIPDKPVLQQSIADHSPSSLGDILSRISLAILAVSLLYLFLYFLLK